MEEKNKVHHESHVDGGEFKIDNNPDKMISSFGTKMKKNPWMPVSFVLGIVVIILLVLILRGGVTGNVVSTSTAEQNVIDFAKSQGLEATIVNSTVKEPFYEITITIQGKDMPVYVTKDGTQMATSLIPLTGNAVANPSSNTNTNTPPANVPKTDKPKVEAFIFSYCPYGLQFEKALFPVYDLLKNKADIDIVAIGAMHGEFEHQESLRQISIEKIYSRDKLFAYLKEFDVNSDLGNCRGEDSCSSKYLPAIYTKLGIDKAKVDAYMKTNAEKIYGEQGARSSQLGISGSPTFVINGVQVQVDRTAESIKKAICDSFTTAPSECSQTLSTASASAGFGASTGSASASPSSAAGCAPA